MTSESMAPLFLINTTYRIHPDDTDAFKALAARLANDAPRFEGNSFFSVGQDVLDSGVFHLIEGWQSREAFEAALASEAFQGVLKQALQLRITERFGDMIFVSGIQKLEMPA